uniref:NADH-ubiquinone oxidoreductase chain 5 n=1 Tax=Pseudoneureclipsis sibuyana TaxID=2904893 RepID=A0A9E8RT55_9NEOP|nr:NADH dehydrogenase subunit 5 [Pseudoneureclipsis sibuyana]UZZ44295.1 NADH dehydrogenase subunit 5 [Pseudoneureclipsis sibuyana]
MYFNWFFFFFFFGLVFIMTGIIFVFSGVVFLIEWEIVSLNSMSMIYLILFDWIMMVFVGLVLFISSMVIYYSKGYMEGQVDYVRFVYLVLMFILSMILLIISPNLVSLMLGWDGLGLVSFCLVIYYQNEKSLNSGMLTVLMNRVGDVMLLMCIVWVFNCGSWNLILYTFFFDDFMFYLYVIIILSSFTKSAQIPFSSWLPAAMAAPTPVSSLVHSSTLVTAGIYLMFRMVDLVNYEILMKVVLFFSVMTMFMSSMSANMEYDLKKVIALSTLSQLGLMFSVLSLNLKVLCFFHLFIHAIFKSMLFMCAGIIIHMMNNNQDMRYMGGVVKFIPINSMIFMIGSVSLFGLPFTSGFYSKDLIMEVFMFSGYNLYFYMFLFWGGIGMTMMYSLRIMYFMFLYEMNYFGMVSFHESEMMLISMLMMGLFSVVGGSLFSWLLFNVYYFIYMSFYMKMVIYLFLFLGMLLGYFLFNLLDLFNGYIVWFISLMYFLPDLMTYKVSKSYLFLGVYLNMNYGSGWLELLGSQGLYLGFTKMMKINYLMQVLSIVFYMFGFVLWIFFFCWIIN